MKKFIKFLSLSLCLSLILSLLSGCTKSSSGNSSGNQINVGSVFELTGKVASYGTSEYNAIKLYMDNVNKNGGVLGKKINLLKADNKSTGDETINQVTRLIVENHAVAILGPATTGNAKAATSVVMAKMIPLITPSGTSLDVTVDPNTNKVRDEIFRSCYTDPHQGTVMGEFAANDLKAKTAILYIDDSNDYSKGLAKSFKEQFEKLGGKVIGQEAYVGGDQDFNSTLTKIKGKNPDIIFIPGYYQDTAKITKQARNMGITVPLLGGDGWDSPELLNMAGPKALNNVFYSNHFISTDTDPTVQDFIKKYKAAYNNTPDAFAALGYDAAGMLVQAIKDANSTDPSKITKALTNLKNFKGVTGTISIDKEHNPIKQTVIIELKDGKQTLKKKIMTN